MGKLQENGQLPPPRVDGARNGDYRAIGEDCEEVCEASSASMESSLEYSSVDSAASSSSEMVEDALSPTSNSSISSSSSNGPLYELSELMAHLPIKRGLSKYYDGKSESHTSLASVKSLEDLAKRVSPIRKRIKLCKSFGGGFDGHKSIVPRAAISKKASRSRAKNSLLCGSRSAIPVNWH